MHPTGQLDEPGELAGADHPGLVEQQHAIGGYVSSGIGEESRQRGRRCAGSRPQPVSRDGRHRDTSDVDSCARPCIDGSRERAGLPRAGGTGDDLDPTPRQGDLPRQVELIGSEAGRSERRVDDRPVKHSHVLGRTVADGIDSRLLNSEHVDGGVRDAFVGEDRDDVVLAQQLPCDGQDLSGGENRAGRQVLADLAYELAPIEGRCFTGDPIGSEDPRCQVLSYDGGRLVTAT